MKSILFSFVLILLNVFHLQAQGWAKVYYELEEFVSAWSLTELSNNTFVITGRGDVYVQVDSSGNILYLQPENIDLGASEHRFICPTPLDNGNYNIYVQGGILEVSIGDSIVSETFFDIPIDSLPEFGRPHSTLDGGYLLYGLVPYPPNNPWSNRIALAKYDSTYQLEWVKHLGDWTTLREVSDLVILPDSSYIINIHQRYGLEIEQIGAIMKISAMGDSLWTKYPDLDSEVYPVTLENIIATSDGNYLAAGKTPSWGAYVVKFNAEGEKLWSQSYPIRYRKIIELNNQDFLIIGMSSNNDNSSHNIVILRMDSVGNYLWHRYINFYNPDLFFTANYPTTVLQTSEQGFLIGGGTEYFTIGNDLLSLFLIKTDSLGNCHPYTNYNYTSDPIGTTVDFMNESWGADTYLWNFGDGTTSTVEQPSHTYDVAGQYMVCLKARNLCDSTTICQIVTAGQVVGIAENETNFAIQVLSNPVQDILTLQGSFAAQNETDLHIRLYHSNGSQVYISKLLLTNSTFQHQIPVSDLPSGVYFLQVQGEKSNVVQKVIVQ